MTPDEKVILKVKRILNDPALLKNLAVEIQSNQYKLDQLLTEVNDPAMKAQLRAAILAAVPA